MLNDNGSERRYGLKCGYVDRRSAPPVDSAGIADLARRAADLNQTIRDLATHPNHRKTLRKFVGSEVAALLDLKVETLYRRLDRNPSCRRARPPIRGGANLRFEEIFVLREAFKLPPKRAPGQPGLVVSICNFKGGVAKTTTAAHLAQYLVMRGYRVLLVDLDAQASLTQLFGILPHTEVGDEETVRTFLEGPRFRGHPEPATGPATCAPWSSTRIGTTWT